jgi:hypothetical protein
VSNFPVENYPINLLQTFPVITPAGKALISAVRSLVVELIEKVALQV